MHFVKLHSNLQTQLNFSWLEWELTLFSHGIKGKEVWNNPHLASRKRNEPANSGQVKSDRAIKDMFSRVKSSWNSSSQGRSSQDWSSQHMWYQVGTGQVKSGQVKASQDWSSPVNPGQVKFFFTLNFCYQEFFWPKIFLPKILLDPKFCWPKSFFYQKCFKFKHF